MRVRLLLRHMDESGGFGAGSDGGALRRRDGRVRTRRAPLECLERVAKLAGARDDEESISRAPCESAGRQDPGWHGHEVERALILERRQPERVSDVERSAVPGRDHTANAVGRDQGRNVVEAARLPERALERAWDA